MNYITSTEHYKTLDGWRAVAILGVILCHGSAQLFGSNGVFPNPVAFSVAEMGAVGVDIFFGLSGFLICSRLLQEEKQRGTISLRAFYTRRAFRILPACLCYLTVITICGSLGMIFLLPAEAPSSLLFVRNYLPMSPGQGWFTGHFWSLAVEEHFYLFWPALLVIAHQYRLLITIVLCFIVSGWRFIDFHWHITAAYLPNVALYCRTDLRLDALLWGCVAALLLHSHAARWFHWLTLRSWTGLLITFFAVVALKPLLILTWQAMLIPLLLMGTIIHSRTLVGRLLETGLMRWIGRISFGLYLWQQLFLGGPQSSRQGLLALTQSFPYNFVAVFLAAVGSYYLVERPINAYGHRVATNLTDPLLSNKAS